MTTAAEHSRRFRERHRDEIPSRRAELRRAKIARDGPGGERARGRRSAHGADFAQEFAVRWAEQDGRCYLCGDGMEPDKAQVDHDHRCCRPGRSCAACRRGLACIRCNRLIGQVGDDPALLRRIASNLESRASAAQARIASKPVQFELAPPGAAPYMTVPGQRPR